MPNSETIYTHPLPEPLSVVAVDHDPKFLESLSLLLPDQNFYLRTAQNATDALKLIISKRPHVVVMDDEHSEILLEAEPLNHSVKIVLDEEFDNECISDSIDRGAHMFIPKPLSPEVPARIRAAFRRHREVTHQYDAIVNAGDYTFDLAKRIVMRDGVRVKLSHQETSVVMLLASNPGIAYRNEKILENLGGYIEIPKRVNMIVHGARKKLKRPDESIDDSVIKNRRKLGYYIERS